MAGIDHLDLVVSDLERSLAFYRGLLEPLGYTRTSEIAGERGERVVYIGTESGGQASVSLRERHSRARSAPYDRYDVGIHHLAFGVESREVVDDRARWAREHAEIESGPQGYEYTDGYYAVFLHDPDGLKLEVVHRPGGPCC